eukprot:c12923_g1_i1.p1 GENE.c12923_g1_i1~~c12923_g1_i1.p1  ORF type:complete len:594 (-),score=240.39 c12923_g1_i1:39-1820(-)
MFYQQMSIKLFIISLIIIGNVIGDRLPQAPYPIPSQGLNSSQNKPIIVYSFDDTDSILVSSTLAGVSAKQRPMIFRYSGDQGRYDVEALVMYFNVSISTANNVNDLFSFVFSNEPNAFPTQYIFCSNSSDINQRNAAVSLSTAQSVPTIILTSQYLSIANKYNLINAGNITSNDTPVTIFHQQLDLHQGQSPWSRRIALLTLNINPIDYAIFANAFMFYADPVTDPLSPESKLMKIVFDTLEPMSAVLGWIIGNPPREYVFVTEASTRGSYVHCADSSINLSGLSGFSIDSFTQISLTSLVKVKQIENKVLSALQPEQQQEHAEQQQKKDSTSTTAATAAAAVHTVAVLWSDGDNIGSFDQSFFVKVWQSPARGIYPMGWTMAPVEAELNPAALKRFYDTATPNDEFVGGPSGFGYTYPDVQLDLKVFANMTATQLLKLNMVTLNSIQANPINTVAYPANFSNEFLKYDNVQGVFIYDYFSYNIMGGKVVSGVNGKPVIGARLWLCELESDYDCTTSCGPGCQSMPTVVKRLKELPKDPSSLDGYTLVSLNAWENTVEGVNKFFSELGPGFEFVLPSVFVSRVAAVLKNQKEK